MDDIARPDRREGQRVLKIQECSYQLAQVIGQEVVEFLDGHALTLNASSGGNLLLMPQPPERRQVFEVHQPLTSDGETPVKIVEACWTRELTFGAGAKVYLVGVRSLIEPARANQPLPVG